MFNLIPSHTYDYEHLWALVSGRNRWFIKVRYIVVLSLFVFILGVNSVLELRFSTVQLSAILLVTASILIYNIIFTLFARSEFIRDEPKKFNQLHFALLQMVADLISLTILIYYTGGIESPFYVFFIFHMLIGSMILPGFIIYSIAVIIIILMGVITSLEYIAVIPHYSFGGMLAAPLYNNHIYVIIAVISFGIMILVSVFLANNIASAHFRREQELKLALEKLSEAEIIKQKYTMGIVHEIKTPVVAVQSYLDLVLGKYLGPVSEKIEEKIARARVRTDEAIHIINEVLSISKLKLLENLNEEKIYIEALIADVLLKRSEQAEYSRISLKYTDTRTENKPAMADKSLLSLAFSNLIGNSIKYNTPGGRVEVNISDVDGRLVIEVNDDGIGIPETDRQKIFKEFFRASNAKQKGFEGTGLGLSVVKQIIEHHNGIISFKSPSPLSDGGDRQGTSFIITLPYGGV